MAKRKDKKTTAYQTYKNMFLDKEEGQRVGSLLKIFQRTAQLLFPITTGQII
jgi:hypothetical protein